MAKGVPAAAHQLGWQPSRFLADRAEAERAYQLAERLGSVNAAAAELGTTWPSLRKAFQRHGLGMPERNPEAVRQRTIAAASGRAGQPRRAAAGLGVRGAQPSPAPGCARLSRRAGGSAAPCRGDRDAQLPHRGRTQRREPARPPAAGRHHHPPP